MSNPRERRLDGSAPATLDVEDFTEHMVSRRSVLRYGVAAAGVAAGGMALAGCTAGGGGGTNGQGGTSGGSAGGAAPQAPAQSATLPTPRSETVIIGAGLFTGYGNYNPFVPNVDYANGAGQVLKEYLFYLNVTQKTNNLQPWQATGWTYNADYTQITFHLDPTVHWNDGQPFTSKDVKFTIELFQKNSDLVLTGLVYDVTDAYNQAASVETPDDHTVVINLKGPNPRYHYNYICSVIGAFLIVPEHIWASKNPTTFTNNPPVFTGPYKLKEANRDLGYYLWEKDPNYWNKAKLDPKPNYVGYVVKAGTKDVVAQEFKEAKFDNAAPYDTTVALIKSGYKKAIITEMVDPCARAILINCDKSKGVLADPRMHYVISKLLDREYIAKSIWTPVSSPVTYPWPAYSSLQQFDAPEIAAKFPLTYDPAGAATLLDQMGATKGSDGKRSYQGKKLNFTIINPGPNDGPEYQIGQLLVQELEKVGISANLRMIPTSAAYQQAVDNGQYDMRSEWGLCSPMDPFQTYSQYSEPTQEGKSVPVGGNDVRLADPKLNSLVAQLRKSPPDPSNPAYKEALTEWFTQMPVIPTVNTVYGYQANTTYWTNWPTNDNLYQSPASWWGNFLFVIGALKPTGKA